MGRRGAAISIGLLLTTAACTSGPAASPAPAGSSAPGGSPTTVAGPAATSSAAEPGVDEVSCADSIDQATELPGDYRVVADVAAVPDDRVLGASASGERDPAARLFAKWGLTVRTGQTVEIDVAPGWQGRARVGWGVPGEPVTRVRVTACPVGSAPGTWTVYAGGTWVSAPACVPIVIRANGRSEQTRLPIGVPCG